MVFLKAVVLGVVQGLTEFLPISSSAHLRIVPALLGWDDPGAAFTAVVQLGTVTAVVIYFWGDLWRIASTWLRSLRDPSLRTDLDARMGWYLIIGTIPVSVLGLVFSHEISTAARDLRIIAGTLIVLGLVLLYAEKVGSRRRDLEQLTTRDGVLIGVAQAAALVPGVSRSGSTITAGMFLGLTREAAARYSFLLSVPAVVLSGLFELKDVGSGSEYGTGATIVATILAFVVGYAAIAWFLRYLVGHSFAVFVWYRVALGLVLIVVLATGAVHPNDPALGHYLTIARPS